jgi:uncharacterized membrane protein
MTATPGRTAWIILVLSLALNCFFLGVHASGWLSGHGASLFSRHDHPRRLLGMPHPRELFRALPDSAQPVLKDTMAAHRAEVRERITALAAARREVAAAMQAEPYERARLEAAFEVLRAREADVAAAAQATILDLADRLTPEDRARIADLMPVRGPRAKHP